MNNGPIPIRPSSVDFTPPDFDADDWISHAFSDNGQVKLVIRTEHGEDGPTFSPVEAREIGTRLIQLSFEITTTIARENGLRGAAPLRDVMMQLGVDYTDEIHAALTTSEDAKGGDNA